MQDYTVASGIIQVGDQIVFVQNKRRNGSLDWSTPGGVVDPGEGVLEALGREVLEETALSVADWSPLRYSVDVDFIGRPMSLHAEVYRALDVAGDLTIDDPDHVVVDGRWVGVDEAVQLLDASPIWVAEPLRHELRSHLNPPATAATKATAWRYEVVFGDAGHEVHRLEGAGD